MTFGSAVNFSVSGCTGPMPSNAGEQETQPEAKRPRIEAKVCATRHLFSQGCMSSNEGHVLRPT